MTAQERLLTVEEFGALPDDGRKYELIEGVLVEMSGAMPKHSKCAALFIYFLMQHTALDDLGLVAGELGCVLDQALGTVTFADVAFVSNARLGKATLEKYVPTAPDLAIEIVSPTDKADVVLVKVKKYLDAGTRLVWLVYLSAALVHVYRAIDDIHVVRADGVLDGEDVLPGFKLPMADIFNRLER
jgi:Uma2 family endonuclease